MKYYPDQDISFKRKNDTSVKFAKVVKYSTNCSTWVGKYNYIFKNCKSPCDQHLIINESKKYDIIDVSEIVVNIGNNGNAYTATSKSKDGETCKKCNTFSSMSEPNQNDGSFICYGCRI